jgi:hypothetical protein
MSVLRNARFDFLDREVGHVIPVHWPTSQERFEQPRLTPIPMGRRRARQ